MEQVETLEQVRIAAWKVRSGESSRLSFRNLDLIEVGDVWQEIESQLDDESAAAVESISLNNNGLNEVPKFVARTTNVRKLWLHTNNLANIDIVSKLANLQLLDISSNPLTELPEKIANLRALTEFYCNQHAFTDFPQELTDCQRLEALELTRGMIGPGIPESIGNLSALASLDLHNNVISDLPSAIGMLVSLERLDLSNNQLAYLPEAIGRLAELTELRLSANELEVLPSELCGLPKLESLWLDQNLLSSLPEHFGRLQLSSLHLSHNLLTALPQSIENMLQLEIVEANSNKFEEIPGCLEELPDLWRLEFNDNPVASIPRWVFDKQGLEVHVKQTALSYKGLLACLDAVTSAKNVTLIVDDTLSVRQLPQVRGLTIRC